jgi:hypothetical protein
MMRIVDGGLSVITAFIAMIWLPGGSLKASNWRVENG